MAKDYIPISEYNKLKEANGGKDLTRQQVSSYISSMASGSSKQKARNAALGGSSDTKQRTNAEILASNMQGFLDDYSNSYNAAVENYNSRLQQQFQGGTENNKARNQDLATIRMANDQAQRYSSVLNRYGNAFNSDYTQAANDALNELLGSGKNLNKAMQANADYWGQFKNEDDYKSTMDFSRISKLNKAKTEERIRQLEAENEQLKNSGTRMWNGDIYNTSFTTLTADDDKLRKNQEEIEALRADIGSYNQLIEQPKMQAQRNQYLTTLNLDEANAELASIPDQITSLTNEMRKLSMAGDHEGASRLEQQLYALRDRSDQLTADVREASSIQQYNDYMKLQQAPDFDKLSKANFDLPGTENAAGNLSIYEYINGKSTGKQINDELNANPLGYYTGTGFSKYGMLTDEEKGVYNYLFATQGGEAAYKFLQNVEGKLNEREMDVNVKSIQEAAHEAPVLMSGYSVVNGLMSGAAYLGQALDLAGDGQIDKNAGYNLFSRANTEIRGAVDNDIKEHWISKGKTGQWASFAYQTGMSMADFLFQAAVGGSVFGGGTKAAEAFTLAIMGTGAAANGTLEALDRGLSSSQAFTLGTIAGAAEIISEKISIEALFDEAALNTDALKYILQNFFFEGSEEVESDVINSIADLIISKDKSEWSMAIAQYQAQGMSEQAAFIQAMKDQAMSLGMDFLGGAVSGGIMGVGGVIGNNIRNTSVGKDLATIGMDEKGGRQYTNLEALANSLIEDAKSVGADTESGKVAADIEAKRAAGKKITMQDLGRLFESTTNAKSQALDMDENEYRQKYQAEIMSRRFENVAAAELVNEGKIKVEEATRGKAVEKGVEEYVKDTADERYRNARKGKDNQHYFLGTIDDGKEVVSFSDMKSIEWDQEHGLMFEVEHEDGTKSDVPLTSFNTGEDIGDAFELARKVCEGSDITDASVLSDVARTAIAARMAGNITSDQLLPGFLSIYGAARRGMEYLDALTASVGDTARASVNRMTDEQKQLAFRAGDNAGRIMSAKDGSRNMGKGLAVRITGKITKTMSQKLAALNDFMVAIGRHGSIFDNLQISDIKAEEGATILTWQDPSRKGMLNAAYVKHKDGTVEYYFNRNSQDTSYMFVAVHESLHDIRANLKSVNGMSGEQVYQKVLALVSDFYKKQGVYNDMLAKQISLQGIKDKNDIKAIMYDHANNSLLDAAQEELVANALPAILANQNTMEQFALMVAEADGASRHAFERFIYNVKQFLAEALKALTGRSSWAQLKAIAENQRLVDDLYTLYEDAFTRLAKQNAAPSQMAGQEFTQAQAQDIAMDQASEITEMPVSANREMYSVVDKDGKIIVLTEEQITANKIEIAQMENVYDVPVNNFKQNADKDLLTMGKEYFASIGGSIYNDILGNVELNEDGLKHLIGQHLTWRKSAMIEAVPSVIANGKIIKIEENHKGYGFDSILIAAPARLENSDCIVGVAVKQNDKKENSYYVHEVYILNKERTTVGNSQSGSKTAVNNDPIYRLLYSIEEIKRNLDNGNEISVEKFSYATFAEPDIKPGLTKAKATKTLGMSPEDITMVANTTNGKNDVVYASGRSVLEAVMKKYAKDNHMSPSMQKATLRFMDRIGKWMNEVAVAEYHYIGLQDLNNAKMKIDWRNGKKVVLSARVKNGEYDVNFDLSKICKKRVAFSNFIDDLATRPGKNGKATMLDEVDLSPENIFKMNQILKDMGYETACLGCFVESRRYGIKTWAETIVNEWNARVDQIDPNAGYFDFAGGSTSADIDTISAKEIRDIDNYMKDFKQRVKDVGADVASEENKAKIEALEEEKKQRKAEISASKTMSKDEKKVARNQIDAEYNPQIAELKMNAQAKMLPLIQSDPRMVKKLRVGDLISSQGRTALHEYSAELESIVASRFGTSSPKSVEAFAPYNSEIALLPDTKSIGRGENKVTMSMGEYLSSIAGARSQSFSDFIISQVYDHLQKTADLAARGFKAHTYTKEIARAMLFGMTGEKINMSVMFDINPDVDWQYAGLEGNSMDSDYSVADYKHAAAVAGKTGEKQFTYSIPFAKAVEIEHNPLYSKDCGIIGVGHSYFGMLKMFRDERVPYIIGYHRSGMPEAIMKATHIELSADYTSVQNTLKFGSGVQFRVVNNAGDYQVPSYATWGGSAKKDVKASDLTFDLKKALADNGGDGRAAMQAFLDFMQDNSLTPNVSKAVPGHGSFDLYGDLEKTMDPNKTANNYIAWCINNNMVPMFYEFAAEPEYSKILFDFSVRDLANNGACSPQRAVSMDGLIALGEDAWESIASRFMKQYDDYMKEQFFGDKYEETLNQIYDSILADELRPYDMSAPQNASEAIEAAQKFSVVDDDWSNVTHDDKENARRDFETGNTTKVYRAMQLVDGKLYPPMAAVVDGKMVGGVVAGDIVVSDERPDLAILQYWDKDGKYRVKKTSPLYGKTYKKGDIKLDEETGEPAYVFQLVKGTKSDDGKKQTDVPARYNPYIHTSRSMINDQFSSAWKRSHLVTVEVEIPNSELTAGYWAEKAKDAVGEMTWKSGPVSGQLAEVGDPRKVILSRYCKIGAIISTEEVAKLYADKVVKHGIEVPFNTVQPALRDELVTNGVKIGPPESGTAGKSAIPSYNEWAEKHADQKFSAYDSFNEYSFGHEDGMFNMTNEGSSLTEDEYATYVDKCEKALKGDGRNDSGAIKTGKVKNDLVDALEKWGIRVNYGAKHKITGSFIRHIKKHHGNVKTDEKGIESVNRYGVTDADLYAIPYIVENAQRTYLRHTGDAVLYVFEGADTTYYVEQILGKRTLSGVQMIKARRGGNVPYEYKLDVKEERVLTTSPDVSNAPRPYVHNVTSSATLSDESVPSSEPSVKMSVADTDDTRSVRDAIRENEKTLKLLAKLNGGDDSPIIRSEKLSRRQMNAIARELCDRYGSSAKYKEVADILYEAFGPIFDPSVEVDSMQLLSDAAAQIVDNVFAEGSGAAKLDEMLSYLNGIGPVMLSSAETQEIKSSFGTFNAFKSYLRKLGVKMQFRVYNAKEAGSAYMSDSFFADLTNSEVGYLFPYEYDGSQVMSLIGELDKLNDHKLVNVYGKGMETRENAIMEIVDELIARSAEYRSEAMTERISRQAGDVMSKEEEKRVGALAKQLSETAQEVRAQMERYQAEQKALNARTAEMVYEAYQEDVLDYEEQIRVLNEQLKEIRSLDEKRRTSQRKTEQALSEMKSKLMSARDHLKARASSLAQMDAYYARELAVNVDAQAQMARAEARKEMAAKYKQQIEKLRNDKKLQAKDLSETMTAYNRVLADVTRQAKKDVRTARKEGRLQRSAEVLERDLRRNYRARIAARTKTMLKMLNGTANVVVPEGARNTIGQFVDIMSQQNKKFDKDKLRLFAQFYRDMGKGTIIGDEAQDLQNMFDEDIADRFDQLIDIIGGKSISELTSDELRQTLDITNVFYHIARHADDVRRRGRSESMKKDAMSLFRQLNAEADRKDHGQLYNNVEGFLVNNQTPYYFFKQAGGILEKYYQDIDNGVRQYTLNVQESQRRIQEIKDQFNYDEWSVDTEENRIQFEAATHRQVSLTRGEAMLIWATNKREQINAAQKADHLRGGGIVLQEDRKNGKNKALTAVANRLTDENLQYIDNWLTPEQKACADALVQYLSADMAELGNEVTMQLYGIRKFDEPYYIPYNCAGTYLNKRVGTGAVNLDNMLKTISFTQRLTTRADAPILVDDIFNVASRHIERMTMYNALCIPLDNMNRLMNYKTRERIAVDEDGHPIDVPLDGDGNPIPLYNEDGTINADVIDIHYDENGNPLTKSVVGDSIRTMLTAKRGTNAVKYIDQFIDDMNGGANTDPRESFGSRMLSMFKKNAVMMSMSVAIQQPSAIGRAFALVDPKYFAQGMASKGSYEELKKYSYTAVLKEIGGFDTGTGRGIADWINGGYEAPTKTKQVLNKIDEVGGYLPGKMDELTWGVIWRAIKLETEAKNPDLHGEDLLRAAGARFDEVINATQVYDSTISRSSNMRSKTWYMKAATAFMAEPTVGYNLLVDAVTQAKKGNAKYAGRAIASFAVAAIINSLLKSLVTAARKQDDDETYGEKYIAEVTGNMFSELNPFGLVPIAKDVISIFDGYTVSRSDMDAIQDIKDAYDTLMNDNKSAMDKINAMAAAVSITTGVPVRNVLRDSEAVYNVISNGIKMAGKGSSQGTRLAMEEALSDVWPFSMWVKSSNKDYAARIIKDYKAGDIEAVEATIRDYQFKLDRQGKTAEDIGKKTESWIKKAVKEAYDAKEIDYDTAFKLLTEIGEIAEKVAFKTLQAVDYDDTEYGDSSSAYVGVYDAIDNGGDVEAAIGKMVKSGYEEKTVRQQAVYGILELYKGKVEGKAKISDAQARTMLTKYGKLSSDDAAKKIKEANVFLTYGVEYTSNYSKLKEALKAGALSKEQAIKILMNVRGYSRDKAKGIVDKW